MTETERLSNLLYDKINEWGKNDHLVEVIVDCFLAMMELDGRYNTDDQINVLEMTSEKYVSDVGIVHDPFIREVLTYHSTAIKVNNGY